MTRSIKDLARELKDLEPRKASMTSPRTLKLDVENYEELQRFCRSKGLHISEVVDKLISTFLLNLEELKREELEEKVEVLNGSTKAS